MDTQLQESFQSPPRRRRSTFFDRRDSFVPQIEENNTKDGKHKEDMQRYFDQLHKEKNLWKEEVKRRRNKYNDLKQEFQTAAKSTSTMQISYSSLSNEDIEFLNGKPSIAKLTDSHLKLHKSLNEVRALYRRASELDNVILSHCEERIKKITNYILEHSTIET